jgi:multiple sugar transport system ATP-binding protein
MRADNAGFGIEVAPELAPRLMPYAGREITMGIRPEDLRVANGSDPAGLCFDAVVEVVERLGSETLLDLQVGAQTMVAAVEPAIRAQHGDKLRLALRADRLHFFDMKSEAAV